MSETVKPSTIRNAARPALPQGCEQTAHAERSRFKTFYARYFPKLVADLRSAYGAGPPEPEDVAQRAFANLNKRGDLASIRDLEGFVWMTSRNIIYSEKRAETVRSRNKDEVQSVFFGAACYELTPERVFMAKEQLSLIMEALAAMPARRRRIFMLNRLHGLNPAEIARRIGVSRPAVVKHIAKATETIHASLEKTGSGAEAARD